MRNSFEHPGRNDRPADTERVGSSALLSQQAASSLAVLMALKAGRGRSTELAHVGEEPITAGAGARFEAGTRDPDNEAQAGAMARDAA
ncbi:MAG: hypothetical protein AB7J40_01725 [Candidatus Altimarinota bacterium]